MTDKIKSHSERDLLEWLSYLENIHHSEIDMGLDRISIVAARLGIDLGFAQVITVAGTNGKGTTCAFIENTLIAVDKTVAVYSSPHIEKFNERLRFNKYDVSDAPIVSAFEKIEKARGCISLTYYEYTTLAAFLVMMIERPAYIILEVGLGGRLDATNVIDADIAVLTTVDLDHQAFLGNDREAIGFEKAGIMRTEQRVVVGDTNPPHSVINHANKLKSKLYLRDTEFFINKSELEDSWSWSFGDVKFSGLVQPNIPMDNVATALMVLTLLDIKLTNQRVNSLIGDTKVAGRTENIVDEQRHVLLDVGHNPLAARYLANILAQKNTTNVHAVVGMLKDKDIENTLQPLVNVVDSWYLASLDVTRGASAKRLKQALDKVGQPRATFDCLSFDNVIEGYKMAKQQSDTNDLILVFGSFHTVAQVKALLN